MGENTDKSRENSLKNLIPWKKGDPSPNPLGHKKGQKNFSTKWAIFIDKVANQNDITVDEVDENLLKVVYKQMLNGDFRYWKDTQDRLYGKAPETVNLEGGLVVEFIDSTSHAKNTNTTPTETTGGNSSS